MITNNGKYRKDCETTVLNSVEIIQTDQLISWCNSMPESLAIQGTNCKRMYEKYISTKREVDMEEEEERVRLQNQNEEYEEKNGIKFDDKFIRNIIEKKQEFNEICCLKMGRYGHGQFVFKSKVYVFGGLNEDKQLVNLIERYHMDNNQWETLDYKFPFKIYSMGLALNGSDLLIIGGRNQNGLLPTIYQIDFINRRYRCRGSFSYRFRPKIQLKQHFIKNQLKQMIYIFGGDHNKTCEKLNPLNFQSLGSEDSYLNIIDSTLSSFSDAQFTMNLDWAQ